MLSMYKIATCHFCGKRFDLDMKKGDPYGAVCRECSVKLNKAIRNREERKS